MVRHAEPKPKGDLAKWVRTHPDLAHETTDRMEELAKPVRRLAAVLKWREPAARPRAYE
jgi:hypothetical protein